MAIDEKKLIDAQEVINLIKENWELTEKDFYSHPKAVELGIGIAIRIIENTAILKGISSLSLKNQKQAISDKTSDNDVPDTNDGKWIPCSERLPEKNDTYQVTVVRYGKRKVDYCFYQKYLKDFIADGKVVAWKEEPEPYKGDE